MELLDTMRESQSKLESTFQLICHKIYQLLYSNSKEESKDYFIQKIKEELENEPEE